MSHAFAPAAYNVLPCPVQSAVKSGLQPYCLPHVVLSRVRIQCRPYSEACSQEVLPCSAVTDMFYDLPYGLDFNSELCYTTFGVATQYDWSPAT